jgi:AAA domain
MSPDVSFVPYVDEPANDWHRKVPSAGAGDYEWAGDGSSTARHFALVSESVSATPYRWIDPTQIPPRQWLGPGRHYCRKFLSVTVAAGGMGKSSLMLLDALSMAAGRDLLTGKKIEPRACWYWNGEDPREELERRVQAIALHYRLTKGDIEGRFFLDTGREQRIVIAHDGRRDGIIIHRPLISSLVEGLKARAIDVLMLDPFVKTHGVPENDNSAIDQVAREIAGIADAANCAGDVAHHVRKSNGSSELTADDARGAGALIGAARNARLLRPMSEEEARQAGIDQTQRGRYFRINSGKSNLAPPSSEASWRQLVSVELGNGRDPYPGDSVGVVAVWTWPDAFAGLTASDLKAVQNKIAGGRWRADVQAGAWAGKAVAEVLGLDLDEETNKTKVKSLLKTWLKNGSLVEAERQDEGRKTRRYVEVGTWVEE